MPRYFTVGALVTRGQQRADMESQSSLSVAEWKGHLSTAYAELYSILVASGMRYFEKVQTITTTAVEGDTYALTDDFLTTLAVDRLVNTTSGERRALQELMMQERNLYRGAQGAGESYAYSVIGTNIVLYPKPPAAQTYEHTYVQQPLDLSTVEDPVKIDVVTPDGEAFLLWSMAVTALAKGEEDVQVAMAERERARERVTEWSTLRALNTPRSRMVDDGGVWRDDGDWVR